MFVLLQTAVLCVAANTAPDYTVHIRPLTNSEQIVHVPLQGDVTVWDAVTSLKQSPNDLAHMDLWVARPTRDGKTQVLRIDWTGIAQRGITSTNYQLRSGDRLFLQTQPTR